MPVTSVAATPPDIFDDDDDGWQEMPVVRQDYLATDLDEEDRKKYHYKAPSTDTKATGSSNATGNLIDFDDSGYEWRSKAEMNETEYTRLRMKEDEESDEVALRTKYLFDEDAAMTPLSQMQATKKLLTESQRIAYVGLCALTAREMTQALRLFKRKELKGAVANMELWVLKIMGRLYYHMELETQEQKMIENLAEHGVQAMDLVPSLMTTHTVANPEYDPVEARKRNEESAANEPDNPDLDDADDISVQTLVDQAPSSKPASPLQSTIISAPSTPASQTSFTATNTASNPTKTTARVLGETTTHMAGVTTSLSSADENVTLDIRWTVLCDLFLILIADSVYDARSRVLLESIAQKLGLGWLDVVRFESRVTEALEIQEDIEKLEQREIMDGVQKSGRRRRYMMLGLATLGGGLVLGLSAGLLAPVIGVGLAGAFSAIGITGTSAFLGGTAGAAAITTGGVLTGSAIAGRGMARRTRHVRTFDILPLHNNKRVNCILTVPGFMTSINDDVRLPFSVLEPIVGDVFSVLWEPDMIRETGSALQIMTAEVLSQVGMTILGATAMTALMSALQWPIILTKLGYLIDNPWNNALDRAKAAGLVLADVLQQRHLGVRPITLIGFSLGARVIFYALLELSRQKAYGIVQDVFLLGATLTASQSTWCQTRAVVSGRYVNAFAKNDWVLNYLFRATSGGIGTVAGLRPVLHVPGLENVDVTDKISGHMSYRTFMPLILDQLGFPVSAHCFDEPAEDIIMTPEVDKHEETGWFKRKKKTNPMDISQPPTAPSDTKQNGTAAVATSTAVAGAAAGTVTSSTSPSDNDDSDLPPRMPSSTHLPRTSSDIALGGSTTPSASARNSMSETETSTPSEDPTIAHIPKHAGFDLDAMKKIIGEADHNPSELQIPSQNNHVESSSRVTLSPIPATPKPLPKRLTAETEEYRKENGFVPMSPSELLEQEKENANAGLAKSFAESVSLKEETSSSGFTASPELNADASYASSPTLMFGNTYDAPAWASSSTNVTPMAVRPERQDSYGFGYNGYKATYTSPSTSSSMMQNPSVMSSNNNALSMNDFGYGGGGFGGNNSFDRMGMDTGLSFGASDGTIVSGGVAYGGSIDSWNVPGDYGKKQSSSTSNGFGSNPWS